MADTLRYDYNRGEEQHEITQATASAQTPEFRLDFKGTMTRDEVLFALERYRARILSEPNFPPA